jgi:hypothetical protein
MIFTLLSVLKMYGNDVVKVRKEKNIYVHHPVWEILTPIVLKIDKMV